MKRKKTPKKPYPDFPLFRHATGQWAKKIKGRLFYFGVDPDAALKKYTDQRDDLHAGRTPMAKSDGATLNDLCNRYLSSKRLQMQAGELAPRTWKDLYETCERLVASLGGGKPLSVIQSIDFEKHRAKLAKVRGPVGLGNEVQRVRGIFKYGFEVGMLLTPIRFGPAFKRPSRKVMRAVRHAAGERMFEAAELRKILDKAGTPMKAMILLGANCGFGQSDLAALPINALDLDKGWVTFPRVKTGVKRRCPLWPETVKAVREALENRPDAKDKADSGLVFITKYGARWVRTRQDENGKVMPFDAIAREFVKQLEKMKIKRKGISFYALRHTFRTIADNTKDQVAVDHIMGHGRDEDMATRYRERIEDARLKAVTDCVHDWLFAPSKNESTPADPSILPFSKAV